MSPPILDPIRGALLRSQPDAKLVVLVREGRERAFEEIVRRYRAPLVGFAAMIVPPDRADDVVQESLLAAYNSLESSNAEIALRPWLFKIVRNRALNHLRDTPAAVELTEELDGIAGPAEIAEQREQVAALFGGLQALPDAQREAIVARELEGRGHAEIAAELGTSPGAVRQLIFRARGSLREAAGLLIPLPLLRFLLGPGGAETGATAAAGAGIGAAAAAGGGAATGLGAKLAVGVAGVALAVGGGFAIERSREGGGPGESASRDGQALAAEGSGSGGGTHGGSPGSGSSGHGDGAQASSGGPGPGGRSGPGGGGNDDARGGREEDGDDSSGPGGGSSGPGGGDDDVADDSSGSGGGDDDGLDDSSGSGGGEDDDFDDSSGSGSSGSGSFGSSSSGSGSSGSDDFEPVEAEIDDSGDSSGSGSSGSDDSEPDDE